MENLPFYPNPNLTFFVLKKANFELKSRDIGILSLIKILEIMNNVIKDTETHFRSYIYIHPNVFKYSDQNR